MVEYESCPECESTNISFIMDDEGDPRRYECDDCGHEWIAKKRRMIAEKMLERMMNEDADDDPSFKEAIETSINYTLGGCVTSRNLRVPETVIRFISNIAALPIEPNETYFKDPDAMFEALYLIYQLLEDIRDGAITVEKEHSWTGEKETWTVPKITKLFRGL
ncbi:hypothetical protein H8E65_01625 [Candidatus Bathyarchaeota archaeon]|nr:hypothetical protein [Candidatus Bathyarchaeota archaeon]